jgi:hypothetical protein
MKRICAFLGSSAGRHAAYGEAARALGDELSRRRIGLVFGGSDLGIMGALADRVLDAGGEVIGVIPRPMVRNGWEHRALTELRVVDSMHDRKLVMYELADAVVALPGGIGTLDELIEVLAWVQLGIHEKPVGLLNVRGYFDPLLEMFRRAVGEGFLPPAFDRTFIVAGDAAALLDGLLDFEPPPRQHQWHE